MRETADIYLPYLAVLPLIAVWSYLLDGLFIGATRAREMRDGMLLTVLIVLPFAWVLQGLAITVVDQLPAVYGAAQFHLVGYRVALEQKEPMVWRSDLLVFHRLQTDPPGV